MDALLVAALNALWQGATLIAVVTLALRAGLRRNATTACVVWSVAFVVVAALPALDLVLARPATAPPPAVTLSAAVAPPPSARRLEAAAPRTVRYAARTPIGPPAEASSFARAQGRLNDTGAAGARQVRAVAVQVGGVATDVARRWGLLLAAAWALVAGVLVLRLALAYGAVARMKRTATPLDDPAIAERLRRAGHRRRATVAASSRIEIPCAVGFRRPMILVPAGLVASLDADDLARVVLHESAHLQRYDDCINALEQLVCAVQFFQPALYLARRRIDFEREVACDDRVLEDSGEPLRYAECLARIVQRHVRGRQAAVVPGFVLRRTQVVARVRRIVDRSRDASPHLRFGAVALGGALLAATLGLARLQVPVVAPAAATPAEPTPVVPMFGAVSHRIASHQAIAPRHAAVHHAANASHHDVAVHRVPPGRASNADRTMIVVQRRASAAPTIFVVRAKQTGPLPVLRSERLPEIEIDDPSVRTTVKVRQEALQPIHVFVTRDHALATASASASASATAVALETTGGDSTHRVTVTGLENVRVIAQVQRREGETSRRDDDLLSAIDDAKYPHPSVDALIALKTNGVSASYVRAMGSLGTDRPTLDQLVKLAMQGVSASYFATLQRALATAPTIDDAIALRMHGVSAAWLEGFATNGYPKLSPADAIKLADQGISPSYVRGLLDAGLRGVTPDQLIALRNAGVEGSFVRRLYAHGYRNFGVDEIVRLKMNGVEP